MPFINIWHRKAVLAHDKTVPTMGRSSTSLSEQETESKTEM